MKTYYIQRSDGQAGEDLDNLLDALQTTFGDQVAERADVVMIRVADGSPINGVLAAIAADVVDRPEQPAAQPAPEPAVDGQACRECGGAIGRYNKSGLCRGCAVRLAKAAKKTEPARPKPEPRPDPPMPEIGGNPDYVIAETGQRYDRTAFMDALKAGKFELGTCVIVAGGRFQVADGYAHRPTIKPLVS